MNKENLELLADFLANNVKKKNFSMSLFHPIERYEVTKKDYNCETVACAAGYGPIATGIEKDDGEDWLDYSERVFEIYGEDWHYCFSYDWNRNHNTPKAAAKRIRKLIKLGHAPENFNYD